ncbi:MAG: hypothetical protein U1A25_01380 [Candidatus Sungbacteria bacterium]|nr:hypothetical protein [Candidatus Sungbacteria bacterium]
MEITIKKLVNFLLILGFIAFLSVGLFGSSHSFGMEMKDDGTMSGCLFTGMDEVCTMTFTQHRTAWQNMFSSIPVKSIILSLLALVFSLLLFAGFLKQYGMWARKRMESLQKLYFIHHPNLFLFNPLQEAFSRGILNPKIY